MSRGPERRELAPWCSDACGAGGVRKGYDTIGIAHKKGLALQRHAKRLAQAFEQGLADFGAAVAIGVAQQRNAIWTRTDGSGALHRGDHRMVEHRTPWARHEKRLGDGD